MRLNSTSLHAAFGLALAALTADPAWAGTLPVPGPELGAGLPALALFGAGYWLIRRRRQG